MEENDSNKKNSELRRELKVNELNKETKTNFLSRIIISVLLVAFCIPTIVLGGYFTVGLVLFLLIIITHEICKAPQSIEKRYHFLVYVFSYIMMFLLVFGLFLKDVIYDLNNNITFDINLSYQVPEISPFFFILSCFFFFLEALFDKKFSLRDAFYFIVMIFTVSFGLQCMIYLRFLPFEKLSGEYDAWFKYGNSFFLFIYVIGTSCFTDVFAYLFGIFFGKHKMCPNISPKKTWEGFIGGILFGFLISFAFGMICSYFNAPLLEGVLDLDHWYLILILSFCLPFIGTFGDLFFSKIKREFNIKDFGTILKSHGGILDRFDSILFSFIFAGLYILIIQ